jgi:hypothetical protein
VGWPVFGTLVLIASKVLCIIFCLLWQFNLWPVWCITDFDDSVFKLFDAFTVFDDSVFNLFDAYTVFDDSVFNLFDAYAVCEFKHQVNDSV